MGLFTVIDAVIHEIRDLELQHESRDELVRQALAKAVSDHGQCVLDIDPLHVLRTFCWSICDGSQLKKQSFSRKMD